MDPQEIFKRTMGGKNRLSGLEVDEISILSQGVRPAVKGAVVSIAKADGSASAEEKLETLAKAHADKRSVPFAKAYTEVLETDEGRQLYREHLAEDPAKAVQKRMERQETAEAAARAADPIARALHEISKVDDLIDELVRKAQQDGETFEKAYARVIAENPQLYTNQIRVKKAQGFV
ncbi:hypothetical protein [Chelativorans alearense]|uniref:hypothetical protein n=1 Tax=Chelativorans alearense TaxID=2681495 RepID=UPI0013CF9F97|nr:hypothetical protein [Chelativorans alearense]